MYECECPPISQESCLASNCPAAGEFECLDCELPYLLCRSCLLERHRHLPFHRPLKWNGSFFQVETLCSLGLILSMGHGEKLCPYGNNELGPQMLTVLDVSGVHEVRVMWCRCATAATYAKQLFSRRLFPATIQRPKTVFTFRVLNLFHLLNHIGRTTPWDFAGTMHRLTDNVRPSTVTVSFHTSHFPNHCLYQFE